MIAEFYVTLERYRVAGTVDEKLRALAIHQYRPTKEVERDLVIKIKVDVPENVMIPELTFHIADSSLERVREDLEKTERDLSSPTA